MAEVVSSIQTPAIYTLRSTVINSEADPGRVPPLNFFEDSLVVSPSGVVATNLLYHIAPDRDIGRLTSSNYAEAVGLFSSNLVAALAWGGEVIKHLTRAQREAGDLLRNFEYTAEHCTELETWLADMEAARAEEERVAETHLAALETRGLRLEAEKAALMSVKKALEVEKMALRAVLDETKARAAEEAEHLRSEAVNAWDLGKEAFLKSSEFSALCTKKALGYFKVGFSGFLAQFRANGYSEEEHPTSFLDVRKTLMDMANEEEAEEEEGGGRGRGSRRYPTELP
ncbi:myosin-7-like [Dorcoceras hygrometricum]|uniref:Myosin-7-like n=1 Tax=Dorcoceras hygrometricum TaxID=472368 RepID=A0A2Z7CL18_9LAMI|nr:myosin-7-like [Dorcoceras hygrometricum]